MLNGNPVVGDPFLRCAPPRTVRTLQGSTGDYLSQWLRHSRGRVRSKTFEGYEGVIRLYATPGIGEIPSHACTPCTCSSCTPPSWRGAWAVGTMLNLHLVLHQALSQAVRLRERWAGWRGEPFTSSSPSHVSVYERG